MSMWSKEMRNTHNYETDPLQTSNKVAQSAPPIRGEEGLVDAHQSTMNEQEIKSLDQILTQLQENQQAVEISVEHNERRSMNIALDYLDTNSDGKIKPENCPRLSASLFKVLEGRKGEITRDSMNEGIMKLSKRIETSYTRMKELSSTPSGHVSNEELRSVTNQYHADRKSLRELNAYFHQYFVQHVFNALNEDVKQESVDIGFMQKQLSMVESQAILVTDPMNDHHGADIVNVQHPSVTQSDGVVNVTNVVASARQSELFSKPGEMSRDNMSGKEGAQYQSERSTQSGQRL